MSTPAITYDQSVDKRREYGILRASLLNERSSFEAQYAELANFVKPRRVRLFFHERNRGDKRNQKIMDSTATYCFDVLRAGMLSGLTNPALPWIQMGLSDPDLAKYLPVKVWLKEQSDLVLSMFLQSNDYTILPTFYSDEALFGTAAMGCYDDVEDLVRSYSYPIGSYACGMDDRGTVNTFVRDMQMTVRQIVKKFAVIPGTNTIDWTNISEQVKTAWDKSQYEDWHDVSNVITPNEDYDGRRADSRYKPFGSCWFEVGKESNRFLQERGYNEFPVFIGRWEVTGEDTYGSECPGMQALPDIKQLQTGERRSLQAIEKMVNPPLQAPTSLRTSGVSVIPGGTTYTDVSQHQAGVRPLYDTNFAIDKMEAKQAATRQRIKDVTFTSLFLMLAQSEDPQKTAFEIAKRYEEKLQVLGPVVNRNSNEVLQKMVMRHWQMARRAGMVSPPPDEVRGHSLLVRFDGPLHQALKMVGVTGQERFMQNMVQLAQVFPEAKAKVKVFRQIDIYADQLSIDPSQLRTDDEAQELVDQANRAQAAAQAAQTAKDGATAAKTLSETNVQADNGLTRIMNSQAGSIQ